MKKILYFFSIFLATSSALSQPAKKDFIPMFPENAKPATTTTVSLESLSESQKSFLSDSTTQNDSGFLSVRMTDQYLDEIINLDPHVGFNRKFVDVPTSINGLSPLGQRRESKFSEMLLFGDTNGVQAVLTRWDFHDDGASIVSVDEYLNKTLLGIKGTLALVTSPTSANAIWKFSGNDEFVNYEILLVDTNKKEKSAASVELIDEKMKNFLSFLISRKSSR